MIASVAFTHESKGGLHRSPKPSLKNLGDFTKVFFGVFVLLDEDVFDGLGIDFCARRVEELNLAGERVGDSRDEHDIVLAERA